MSEVAGSELWPTETISISNQEEKTNTAEIVNLYKLEHSSNNKRMETDRFVDNDKACKLFWCVAELSVLGAVLLMVG